MALNPASIQALTPKASPYKAADGNGLYLLVTPAGKKYWRLKYRWQGKESTLSCGVYPDVDLDEAREHREAARMLLGSGVNPSEHARQWRAAQRDQALRQQAAMRFCLDSDGALSFRLGNRSLVLTSSETSELRVFLDATRAVAPKVAPCP